MKRILSCVLVGIVIGCVSIDQEARSTGPLSKLDTSKKPSKSSDQGIGLDSEDNIIEIDTNVYRSLTNFDTTYTFENDVFRAHVVGKFDSSKKITIPKKYLELVGISSFSVFETRFELRLERNSEVIVDTVLSKSNFEYLADSSLLMYGVLQFPKLQVYRDSLILGFSYTIPLSDVGVYAPLTLKFYE